MIQLITYGYSVIVGSGVHVTLYCPQNSKEDSIFWHEYRQIYLNFWSLDITVLPTSENLSGNPPSSYDVSPVVRLWCWCLDSNLPHKKCFGLAHSHNLDHLPHHHQTRDARQRLFFFCTYDYSVATGFVFSSHDTHRCFHTTRGSHSRAVKLAALEPSTCQRKQYR